MDLSKFETVRKDLLLQLGELVSNRCGVLKMIKLRRLTKRLDAIERVIDTLKSLNN